MMLINIHGNKSVMVTTLFSLLFVLSTWAVPLENWRHSFFDLASQYDNYKSSPSGLFWDDLNNNYSGIFNKSLWPDSSVYNVKHWIIEPALSVKASNDEFLSGKSYNFHFDALSDFQYGPLTVRIALDVDQEYQSDPYFPWMKQRGASGLIEEAYLQYTGKYGFARLGRLKRNWGPFPDRSILLSNNSFAYDAFEWAFQVPFLEFRHLFTALPNYHTYLDTGDPTTKLNRYFAAHSLNFILGKYGSIGVSETVIFGRKDGFPDFQYINPFSIYSVLNTNGEGAANLMLGFQGWFHPYTPKITIKGQVVFDDFQVDNEDAADQEPTHWACDFGIYWSDPSPLPLKHKFSFEYRYLSKWMYTVSDPNTINGERYAYLGKSLGMQDIDGDRIFGEFSVIGDDFWAASLGLSLTRQDTNTIYTPWNSNAALGYREETPLSERTHLKSTLSNHFKLIAYFKSYANIELLFENRWIKERHLKNEYEYDPFISLSISAHYSGLAIRFKDRKK